MADPVIVATVRTETVCPPEVTSPLAARPALAEGAMLTGNAEGMAWLNATLAFLGLVEDRLGDAKRQCPQ